MEEKKEISQKLMEMENEEFEKLENPVENSVLQLFSAYHEAQHAVNGVWCHLEDVIDNYGYLQGFILENADKLKGIEGAEQILAAIKEWNKELPEDFEYCYPPTSLGGG